MKTFTFPAIIAAVALSMPVFAEEAHHPEQTGPAQQVGTSVEKMQDNVSRMRTQLERLGKARTDDERQKIMAEHMQTMQENMGIARTMQSGMMGCAMMSGGMGMMGTGVTDDAMARRMDMMEKRMDMMQMMMQGRMGTPPREPAKPTR